MRGLSCRLAELLVQEPQILIRRFVQRDIDVPSDIEHAVDRHAIVDEDIQPTVRPGRYANLVAERRVQPRRIGSCEVLNQWVLTADAVEPRIHFMDRFIFHKETALSQAELWQWKIRQLRLWLRRRYTRRHRVDLARTGLIR